MLLKLPIILSGNSFFIHLLFPNIPGVIPGIVKAKWIFSAAENITTCKHKNYTQRSRYSNRAVTTKFI